MSTCEEARNLQAVLQKVSAQVEEETSFLQLEVEVEEFYALRGFSF
jgi:hypothetical protein